MNRHGPIGLLGGTGLLGEAVRARLSAIGRPCSSPTRAEVDLTAPSTVESWLDRCAPAAVIDAAAYTDVTRAEEPHERDAVFRLNRDTPAFLARACHRLGIPVVFVSTDFVFDGRSRRPYREDDEPAPLQVYGQSKLEGERMVREAHPEALVVRTSTLFGPGRRVRPHYVDAILGQARTRDRIEVVRTPVASPTYAPDLARAILALLDRRATGLVHVVNDGGCSRLRLARETVRLAGLSDRVTVAEREPSGGGPRRPAYAVLDSARFAAWTGARLRPWDAALAAYLGASDG
jgi:dTDP-4-dehydrorhamnose reductase